MEEEAGWDWKPSFAKRQKKKKNTGGYSHIEVFRACVSHIFCKGNPVSPKTKNKTKRDRPGSRGDLDWGTAPLKGLGLMLAASSARKTASARSHHHPWERGKERRPTLLLSSPFSDRDPGRRGQRKVGQADNTLKRS